MSVIKKISAIEIFDSRGIPTVECRVELGNGIVAAASVPSGASVGKYEAVELRDNDNSRFAGKGVLKAIDNIHRLIQPELLGKSPFEQESIDQLMLELDATKQKSKLGANAMLAVSIAVAKAAAVAAGNPFYKYLGGDGAVILPMPLMNILNGGVHANNSVDIQEIMIVPIAATSFAKAMELGFDVYQELKQLLLAAGKVTAVGDEGGFAPDFNSNEDALAMVAKAIESAGYRLGSDVAIALDVAASEFYVNGRYCLSGEGKEYELEAWVDKLKSWVEKYNIISIEDAIDQEDWVGWKLLTDVLGDKVQLVGDDIFVTQSRLLNLAVQKKVANAVLIKPNQVGTLTETFQTIAYAKQNNYGVILSHRSGETSDSYIADIAVAVNAGQIKAGAPCRTDRVVKYNKLLKIESSLGDSAIFLSGDVLYNLT